MLFVKMMDKKEFRVLIKHQYLIGKNTVQAKAWLDEYYPGQAPGKSTVEKWFSKFRIGQMSTEDDARSGRPKDAVTDENIKKIQEIISNDCKVSLNVLADTLGISAERVHHIIREHVGMRKVCANWVPRELTIDEQKTTCELDNQLHE